MKTSSHQEFTPSQYLQLLNLYMFKWNLWSEDLTDLTLTSWTWKTEVEIRRHKKAWLSYYEKQRNWIKSIKRWWISDILWFYNQNHKSGETWKPEADRRITWKLWRKAVKLSSLWGSEHSDGHQVVLQCQLNLLCRM